MKLIDILVQELPKRGGWPVGVDVITMHDDGDVYFDGKNANGEINLPQCSDGWGEWMSGEYSNAVSFEQYSREYLAASKVTVWDGEGLPPVGLMVELMDDSKSHTWGEVTIKFFGDSFAVWDDHGEECSTSLRHVKVRPIRTEAERKREASIAAMREFFGHSSGLYNLSGLYEEIASGKIPGIRLTDDAGSQ